MSVLHSVWIFYYSNTLAATELSHRDEAFLSMAGSKFCQVGAPGGNICSVAGLTSSPVDKQCH